MAGFGELPYKVDAPISPYKIHISDDKLSQLKVLLDLSEDGMSSYWNTTTDDDYGISHKWYQNARKVWRTGYNWRKREAYMNSFPQFMITVTDKYNEPLDCHFLGLFSKKPDAYSMCFLHGWPGSFLEFIHVAEYFRDNYTPETLPFHVIIPDLPGYALSAAPSDKRRFFVEDSADVMHRMMLHLGLGKNGYITSGGDVGSFTARIMAVKYEEAKALHLNLTLTTPPEGFDMSELDEDEKTTLARCENFGIYGNGYAVAHGTKPATMGFVLGSNPMGLLTWIGEKFESWPEEPIPLVEQIDTAMLYWATQTMSKNLWLYPEFFGKGPTQGRGPTHLFLHGDPDWYCSKPFGYSFFPKENGGMPKKWAATTGNMILYKKHTKGGHFGAWEAPKEYSQDIVEFVQMVRDLNK